MTDKGNDPRARANARNFRDRSNAFAAPMYQNRQLTTPVDERATLIPGTQFINPNTGRYGLPGVVEGRFSIPMVPFSGDDLKYRNRAQVMKAAGASADLPIPAIPGVGTVFADDAFFAYAQEQREKQMAIEYDQWRYSQIDCSTPEARAYWQKRDPEYFKYAYENFLKQKGLEADLERIRIFGYNDMSDMWLKFMYDKKLLPGFTGGRVLNNALDFLLPEYANMYRQIGLNMQSPEGNVQPEEPGAARNPAKLPNSMRNGLGSEDPNQPVPEGTAGAVDPRQYDTRN